MEILNFVKEYKRMCNYYKTSESCNYKCPLYNINCYCISDINETLINIVKEWSLTRPQKTYTSELLKIFPHVKLDSNGCPNICPTSINEENKVNCPIHNNYNTNKTLDCITCRKNFWLSEIK